MELTLNKGVVKARIDDIMLELTKDIVAIRNTTETTIAKKIKLIATQIVPVYTGTLRNSGKIVGRRGNELSKSTVVGAEKGLTSILFDATSGEQYDELDNFDQYQYGFPDDPNLQYGSFISAKGHFKNVSGANFLEQAIEIFKGERLTMKGTILGKPVMIPYEIPFTGSNIGFDAGRKKMKAKMLPEYLLYNNLTEPKYNKRLKKMREYKQSKRKLM